MRDYHYEITEDGAKLLMLIKGAGRADEAPIQTQAVTPGLVVELPSAEDVDYAAMHVALQERLYKHKKKKQIAGFGNVSFIPSIKDLEIFLGRFKAEYPNLWDVDRIQKCLVKHVDKCCKSGKFSPAIKYFIIKQGAGSQLASYLEARDDEQPDDDDTQHDIKNTKDLFE